MVDTTYLRTRNIGGSYTLYAGQIIQLEQTREVGSLLRFGNVDSVKLANLDSARLLIFRRTFEGSPEPPTGVFTLEKIISAGDTTWFENDTVMTLDDFPVTDSVSSSSLITDSVKVFVSSQSMDEIETDYLAFEVDLETLLDWREGTVPNDGFLLRAPAGSDLVNFYSSESTRRPYLVINYRDTTQTGADTTKSSYYLAVQDISVYPTLVNDIPAPDRLLLNRSDGHRVHIDFSIPFDSLESRPVAGGRLVFNVDESATMMQAGTMVLHVGLRSLPFAQGDSAMIDYANFTYQANSDTLVYNLTSLLVDYQKGVRDNYGLDLMVTGSTHDFDRLTLFDPHLEIIYAVPFGAGE